MNTKNKRIAYTVALVVIGVVSMLRLVRTIQDGDSDAAVIWIALLIVLAIVVIVLSVASRRARSCVENAASHRPGAMVVPGFTTAEMTEIAAALGATRKGWLPMGGSPVAVVAVHGDFEIWGRKDTEPRWTVRRGPETVTAGRAVYGNRETAAVWLRDGDAAAAFVPAYRPLRATGGMVGTDVDRAVADLTGVAGPTVGQ